MTLPCGLHPQLSHTDGCQPLVHGEPAGQLTHLWKFVRKTWHGATFMRPDGSHAIEAPCQLRVSVNGNAGFTVSSLIQNFTDCWFSKAAIKPRPGIGFTAAGRRWNIEIDEQAHHVIMLSGHPLTTCMWGSTWNCGPLEFKKFTNRVVRFGGQTRSWQLKWVAGEPNRMVHSRLLSLQGSLQLTLTFASRMGSRVSFRSIHVSYVSFCTRSAS